MKSIFLLASLSLLAGVLIRSTGSAYMLYLVASVLYICLTWCNFQSSLSSDRFTIHYRISDLQVSISSFLNIPYQSSCSIQYSGCVINSLIINSMQTPQSKLLVYYGASGQDIGQSQKTISLSICWYVACSYFMLVFRLNSFFKNVSTFFAAKSSSNPSPQYHFILKLARSSYPQLINRSGLATIIVLQCVPVLQGMIRYFF